ncbi:MAG TPA: energy transducer TonB [Caulobacteraceae bacterium]|jgi:TonB family protein|nr:energy transducer TonB [Caulobacteraceae bacterium]
MPKSRIFRLLLGALAGCCLLAGPAFAGDDDDHAKVAEPDWMAEPSFADLAKTYPQAALEKGASGRTEFSCELDDDGRLSHCNLAKETPGGLGFGEASLTLADKFRMKPEAVKAYQARGRRVSVPIHWAMISSPDWLQKPSSRQLEADYPRRALINGVSGKALVRCRVQVDGLLDDCSILSESPLGLGFGEATLRAAHHFRMRPEKLDGQPVEGAVVLIPLSWNIQDGQNYRGGMVGVVLTVIEHEKAATKGIQSVPCPTDADKGRMCGAHPVDWEESPSIDDLQKALDDNKLARGRAQFECTVGADGRLGDCAAQAKTSSEELAAMRALSQHCRTMAMTGDRVRLIGARIILLFDWASLREQVRLGHSKY